jgi:hypothetical protein
MVVCNPLRVSMVLGIVGMSVAPSLAQTLVPLQNATATFSQSGFSVGTAIDGVTNDNLGWAIDPNEGVNQTAAFQTVSNVGAPGGSALIFTLTQNYSLSQHLLGKFRLSLTTDNRSTFADGLSSGGNVTANWTVLNPYAATSFNGSTLNILGDGSVLASGTAPNTDVYTILATTNLVNITGVRLEALPDASLPVNLTFRLLVRLSCRPFCS